MYPNISVFPSPPIPPEITKAVKCGLDDASSNGDGETVKRRGVSKSPGGSGTCDDGCSGSNDSSTALHRPSPLNQVVRTTVEPTSDPTTPASQVPHCEPSQVRRETRLELILNSLKAIWPYNFNRECAPTVPASAGSTPLSAKPWLLGSSQAEREPDVNATLSVAKQAPELPSCAPVAPIDTTRFGQLMSLVRAKRLERAIANPSQPQPTLSAVSPSESVPAAGGGTLVYPPHIQDTQDSYSTHGYSSGKKGPAGIL